MADRVLIGCVTLVTLVLAFGLGIIMLGWLFGIGLRLAG